MTEYEARTAAITTGEQEFIINTRCMKRFAATKEIKTLIQSQSSHQETTQPVYYLFSPERQPDKVSNQIQW